MILTKQRLEQIIKEELENVMTEMEGSVEEKLTHELMMKIWSDMGGAYAMKDEAMSKAQAQVQQMIGAGVDLSQELEEIESQKVPLRKTRPYKRSFHGYDQSDGSGYYHSSRNEE